MDGVEREREKRQRTREREGSESRNVTPNFMLTSINQCCSEACTLLCCPLPHFSSIWIRSAHRPKRARRHGDPVRLSGSKRERFFFFFFPPLENIPSEMNRSSAGQWCEPPLDRRNRGNVTAFLDHGDVMLT